MTIQKYGESTVYDDIVGRGAQAAAVQDTRIGRAIVLLFALLIIPVAAHLLLGLYMRYTADDYWFAARYQSYGFWDAQVWWFQNIQGRYTANFLLTAVSALGSGFAKYSSLLLVVLWFPVMVWMFRNIRFFCSSGPWGAVVHAALVFFAMFAGGPDVFAAFYWNAGKITYAVPLLFFTALAAVVVPRISEDSPRAGISVICLVVILALIATGLTEVYACFQAGVFFCLLVIHFSMTGFRRPDVTALLLAGAAASLLSLTVMLAAPGTKVRAVQMVGNKEFPIKIEYIPFIWLWIRETLATVALLCAKSWFVLSTVFVSGVFLGSAQGPCMTKAETQRLADRAVLYLLAAFFTLIVVTGCSILPAVYVLDHRPPLRAQTAAYMGLVFFLLFSGRLSGVLLELRFSGRGQFVRVIAMIAVAAVAVSSVADGVRSVRAFPLFQTFAARSDAQDRIIREQVRTGCRRVVAEVLGERKETDLFGLADYPVAEWKQWIADYYGLDGVIAVPAGSSRAGECW